MKSNKKNLKQRWRKWRTKINLLTTSIVPRSSAHGRVLRHFGGTPKRANSWEERVAVGVSSSCPLTICHVKTSPYQNVIRFFLPCRNSELREEIYFITEFCGCSRLLAPITLHISTLSLTHSLILCVIILKSERTCPHYVNFMSAVKKG